MKRRLIIGPPRGPSLKKEGNIGVAFHAGKIVAYPTESFYALGADATNPKAIRQLFRLKHREKGKPIALIAGSMQQVQKFFSMSPDEKRLAKKHWPGSLTILLRPKRAIAASTLGSRLIGVRVPAHAPARALLISAPITATSANISGQPPTKSAAKVKRDFPGILVVPGRCGRQRQPSTIVQIVGQTLKVIRGGAVNLKI